MNTTTDNAYRYFVAYAHERGGNGSTEIVSGAPITSFDQVTSIADLLTDKNGFRVAITGWQLLSGPDTGTGAGIDHTEALSNLHRRLDDAAKAANTALSHDDSDRQFLAETLTNHIGHARAAIAALIHQ